MQEQNQQQKQVQEERKFMQLQQRQEKKEESYEKKIEFLDIELQFSDAFFEFVIKTFSLYKGKCPIDYIKQRTKQIIELNPWLNSRLYKEGNEKYMKYMDNQDCSKFYKHFLNKDNIFHENMSYYEISLALSKFNEVTVGSTCINQPEQQLFQVLTIEITEDCFLFLMAINHALGDGSTYYTIYKMFDQQETVHAMNPVRIMEFNEQLKKFDYTKQNSILMSCFFEKINQGKKIKSRKLYKINNDRINEVKNDLNAKLGEKFISTNDILCWKTAKISKADSFSLTINARERIKQLTNNDAGSYIYTLYFDGKNIKAPGSIRQHLNNMCWDQLLDDNKQNFQGLASWVQFYHTLKLPSALFLQHYVLPTMLTDVQMEFAISFKMDERTIGFYIYSTTNLDDYDKDDLFCEEKFINFK